MLGWEIYLSFQQKIENIATVPQYLLYLERLVRQEVCREMTRLLSALHNSRGYHTHGIHCEWFLLEFGDPRQPWVRESTYFLFSLWVWWAPVGIVCSNVFPSFDKECWFGAGRSLPPSTPPFWLLIPWSFCETVHQGLKLAKSLLRIWTISRNTLDQKLLELMYFLWQQPEKIVYYFCGHCQHFVILTKGTQQRELRHLWAKKKSPFFQADKTLYRETSLDDQRAG